MPKVVEILLDVTLIAVIMTLLIAICSVIMKTGGIVDKGFTDIVNTIFSNIKSQLGTDSSSVTTS